jgi:hypothetical protein
VVNGTAAGRATDIRDVQVRLIDRSSSESSAPSCSYVVLLDLGRRRPLKLGAEQPDLAGTEHLARAVADLCGVPLRRTWGEAMTIEIGSPD